MKKMKKMKCERGKKPRKQREAAENPKMGEDLFLSLPSEIIINIRTTMSCKRVCKPWLDLLEAREFVKSHISNSSPGLSVFLESECPKPYKVFEFIDELNPKRGVPRWNMALNFKLPCNEPPYSSVNGLLFLCARGMMSHDIFRSEGLVVWPRDLFICNPITREYIKLPCTAVPPSKNSRIQVDTFGFGVSRMSSQYKLVRVFHKYVLTKRPMSAEIVEPTCQVYSIRSGTWSGITSAGPFKYEGNAKGAFLNDWLVRDMYGPSVWISCFDLETERFSRLSPPPCGEECLNLSTLGGCLCLCDNSGGGEIVVRLMKEYGDEKSWTKGFVIRKRDSDYNEGVVWPIKAFRNGDILMSLEFTKLLILHFSSKTRSFRHVHLFGLCIRAVDYSPSFLPLKTLVAEVENVSSF